MSNYNFQIVDLPPNSAVAGINDLGHLVGTTPGVGLLNQLEAFLDVDGSITKFAPPPAFLVSIFFGAGLNNSDQAVGWSFGPAGISGFIYDAGNFTALPAPYSTPAAIPAASVALLQALLDTTGLGVTVPTGAIQINYPTGINSSQHVSGYYNDPTGIHGYIYDGTSYTTLDDPHATGGTYATGINNSDQVVGYYFDATGQHGFLYSGGSYTTLDDPLATAGTAASGINEAGEIVGTYTDAAGTHGFVYADGAYTTVDDPIGSDTSIVGVSASGELVGTAHLTTIAVTVTGGNTATTALNPPGGGDNAVAEGINNAGTIVGTALNPGSGPTDLATDAHGFIDANGVYTVLDDPAAGGGSTLAAAINDAGKVAGTYIDTSFNIHGFVYDVATSNYATVDVSGARGTSIYGINNDGAVVGDFEDSAGETHGFVDSGGVFTQLDVSPDALTFARGINTAGQVVGDYIDSDSHNHGFLYSGGTYTTIDDPLAAVTIDPLGLGLGGRAAGTFVNGIDDAGNIVGGYLDVDGNPHLFTYAAGVFAPLDVTPPGFQIIPPDFLALTGTNAISANGTILATMGPTGPATSFTALPTAAAPTGLTLDLASDSGVTGDDRTKVTTPKIDGLGEAGATVTLLDGVTTVGTGEVADGGSWQIAASALAKGSHTLTAIETNALGGISDASAPLTITIDTTPPAPPTGLSLDPSTDNGAVGDGITSVTQPKIDGQAEGDATITLEDGTTTVGAGTAAGDGSWSITTGILGLGSHNLTATATDAAGNTGDASSALDLRIVSPPVGPSAPNQFFYTGADNQFVVGTGGNDGTWSSSDGNVVNGLGGDDFLGGSGDGNTYNAGDGNDIVVAIGADNTAFGGDGDDTIVFSGNGDDVDGGAGNDTLWGAGGQNTISGGAGDDVIGYSGDGRLIDPGAGNNTIFLSGTNDTVTGGGGSNLIYFSGSNNVLTDGAAPFNDTVIGFSQAAGDRIHLTSDSVSDALAHTSLVNGTDTRIILSNGSTILLKWTSHIDASMFN